MFAIAAVTNLPASTQQLEVCSQAVQHCLEGWPSKHQITPQLRPYCTVREALTVSDGLLLYNQRIVVPVALWQETLVKLHAGHQGIRRCRLRARLPSSFLVQTKHD